MRNAIVLCACIAAAWSGCTSSKAPPGPPSKPAGLGTEGSAPIGGVVANGEPLAPGGLIGFTPEDFTSSIVDSPLAVVISTGRKAPRAEWLTFIEKNVSLAEWPGGKSVSFKTKRLLEASTLGPNGYRTPARSQIVLIPFSPLKEDRWYAMSLKKKLPAGLGWQRDGRYKRAGAGRISRVARGSRPTVAAMTLCNKGGRNVLSVLFSERINTSVLKANGIRLKGNQVACPFAADLNQPGATALYARFECSAVTPGSAFKIDLEGDGLDDAHRALGTANPPTVTVKMKSTDSSLMGDGCVRYLP